MNFFRMIFGLPMAALVTVVLFFAMAMLIKQEPDTIPPTPTPEIDILFKAVPPRGTPPKPPTSIPKEAPDPPERVWREPTGKPGGIPIVKPDPGKPPVETGTMSGATITIAPQYPEACRAKNAEGAVVVRYDVTDRGEVVNVRIISSAHHCFDRPVIKTVLDWKYPPGQPRRGVEQSFYFELQE
ncbi:MAG: energy transducer TonB [Parvularculaceae bacterium]